jgi:hypothetical protein
MSQANPETSRSTTNEDSRTKNLHHELSSSASDPEGDRPDDPRREFLRRGKIAAPAFRGAWSAVGELGRYLFESSWRWRFSTIDAGPDFR